MRDHPEYSIGEFVLCGLFIGGAVCFFVFAGYSLHRGEPFDALEGAGIGLLLLGGSVDPRKYIADCLTFPLSFTLPAGRDTRLTLAAAGLGLALWLAGLTGNWLA